MAKLAFLVVVSALVLGCGELSDWPGNPNANVCVSGFSPEQEVQVLGALEEWRFRSDGLVTLPIDPSKECDLRIDGVPALESGAMGDRLYAHIRIDTDPFDGQESIPIITMHEIGHFLTGAEHSPVEEDVMFERYRPSQVSLTARDVDRLFH